MRVLMLRAAFPPPIVGRSEGMTIDACAYLDGPDCLARRASARQRARAPSRHHAGLALVGARARFRYAVLSRRRGRGVACRSAGPAEADRLAERLPDLHRSGADVRDRCLWF